MATKDIRRWLVEAEKRNAAYLIVACDTFDYGDYPIYCKTAQECREKFEKHNRKNMQKVMEIYDMSKSIETQLLESRAWHLPN